MKFPLSCADFTFPLLEHEKTLRLIAMLGFGGVDVGLFEGRSHLQPSSEFRNVKRTGKNLGKRLRRLGLEPADIFLQTDPDFTLLPPNHPSNTRRIKAREMFMKTLEYADACGASHVSALPGIIFPREEKRKSWDRCVEELGWRVEKAREANCQFAVEPHIGSIISTPKEALRLVSAVAGLSYTLDYTHFAYQGIADAEGHSLMQYASHFHLRGGRKKRLQASFKENIINYHEVFKRMKQSGYTGYIGIEYVWVDWENCNEVDNLSETILWKHYVEKMT